MSPIDMRSTAKPSTPWISLFGLRWNCAVCILHANKLYLCWVRRWWWGIRILKIKNESSECYFSGRGQGANPRFYCRSTNIFKETIILVPGRRLTSRASWRHWGSFQWRKEAQRRSVFEIDAKSERQSTPRILSASASAHIWWMTILKLLLNLWIYYRRPSNCEVLFSTTTRCLMSTMLCHFARVHT